jgi:hypothetical protein
LRVSCWTNIEQENEERRTFAVTPENTSDRAFKEELEGVAKLQSASDWIWMREIQAAR